MLVDVFDISMFCLVPMAHILDKGLGPGRKGKEEWKEKGKKKRKGRNGKGRKGEREGDGKGKRK